MRNPPRPHPLTPFRVHRLRRGSAPTRPTSPSRPPPSRPVDNPVPPEQGVGGGRRRLLRMSPWVSTGVGGEGGPNAPPCSHRTESSIASHQRYEFSQAFLFAESSPKGAGVAAGEALAHSLNVTANTEAQVGDHLCRRMVLTENELNPFLRPIPYHKTFRCVSAFRLSPSHRTECPP